MFLAQALLKIFVLKAVLALGFLSFLNFPPHLARQNILSVKEQRGGDVLSSANFLSSNLIGKLPLAKNKMELTPRRKLGAGFDLKISAKNFLVVDDESGQVLSSLNAEAVRPIGSITKLMTALVFLKNLPPQPAGQSIWDKEMIISQADGQEGNLFISEGDRVKVKDLFYAALVGSSNNAALALARSTDLSLEDFVSRMNFEAANLGLKKTHFAEPSGLDAQNQSTAKEVALLLKATLSQPLIKEATITKKYTFTKTDYQNQKIKKTIFSTNLLLLSDLNNHSEIDSILGGKTGFVDEAGHCFVTEVQNKAGHRITVAVLGAVDNDSRFSEAKALAEWTYQSYLWPGDPGYEFLTASEGGE